MCVPRAPLNNSAMWYLIHMPIENDIMHPSLTLARGFHDTIHPQHIAACRHYPPEEISRFIMHLTQGIISELSSFFRCIIIYYIMYGHGHGGQFQSALTYESINRYVEHAFLFKVMNWTLQIMSKPPFVIERANATTRSTHANENCTLHARYFVSV